MNTHSFLLLWLRVHGCHCTKNFSITITEHYMSLFNIPPKSADISLAQSSAKSSGGFWDVHPGLVYKMKGDWFPIHNSDLISTMRDWRTFLRCKMKIMIYLIRWFTFSDYEVYLFSGPTAKKYLKQSDLNGRNLLSQGSRGEKFKIKMLAEPCSSGKF